MMRLGTLSREMCRYARRDEQSGMRKAAPVEHIKDLLARGLTHPVVNLREGYGLSVVVCAGLRVGVEIQLLGLWHDRRVFSEVMHIGLRLPCLRVNPSVIALFLNGPTGTVTATLRAEKYSACMEPLKSK